MSISDQSDDESGPTSGQVLIKELRAHLRAQGRLLREHKRRIKCLQKMLATKVPPEQSHS